MLTLVEKLESVQGAVARVRHFNDAWIVAMQANSPLEGRRPAVRALNVAENEFGWQWQNVEALLPYVKLGSN